MSEFASGIGLPPKKMDGKPVPKELQEYLDRLRRAIRAIENAAFVLPAGSARNLLATNGAAAIFKNGDNYGYCDETSVDVIAED